MKRGWMRRYTQSGNSRAYLPLRVMRRFAAKMPFPPQSCLESRSKSRSQAHNQREQGFTLVELLVVLAILGLLIALVAPAMIRQLGSAKHKIAEQSIERLSGVLDLYRLDVGDYPSTSQGLAALNDNTANVPGWNGPYLKDADSIKDPWGRPFQYRYPSDRPKHAFDIISLGADGKPGGEGEDADIINR